MANDLSSFFPTIVAGETLMVLKNNTVIANLVHRDFEDEVKSFGSAVDISKPSTFSVNAKSGGGNVTVQDVVSTKVTLTLNNHKEVTFNIEDVDITKSKLKMLIERHFEPAGIALGDDVDNALLDLNTGLSKNYTPGAVMSKAVVIGSRRRMIQNKTPFDGRVHFIHHPISEEKLLTDETFTSAEKVGDDGTKLREASIGRVFGFNHWVAQNVNVTTATPNVNHNMAFHRNALALVTRPLETAVPDDAGVKIASMEEDGVGLRVVTGYDLDRLATRVTIDLLYAVGELDDTLALEVDTNES